MIRKTLKFGSLALIAAFGVWVLMPEEGWSGTAAPGAQRGADRRDAKYVLKFSPGISYMPGTIPYGIGEPLMGLTQVVQDFEARFPDTRVEIVATPGVREYLVTQLSSGGAPEIINVNVEDVWVDVQKGWYVPLDPFLEAPNPFVVEKGDPAAPGYEQWWDMFKYQAISRGKAAPDNLNYCFSFDMVETGIFYNKNIFREVGVEVPETWDEYLVVCARIKEAGYIPVLMSIDSFNDWCLDLFFDQLYYDLLPGIDLVKDPVREQYLQGYLDWDEIAFLYQQGFFGRDDPRYMECWRLMYAFRQYCNQNLTGTDFIREFVTQRGAMIWNVSALTYRLAGDKSLEFDWGVFYLPRFTKETSQYASGVEMCVIGGSATQIEVTNSAYNDTGDPATSEKLKRVIALLQFLSMPDNYEKVVNEYPCFLPNIVGVEVLPSLQPFAEILERRYTTTKWTFTFDLKFNEIQRRMLELYLNDGITLDELMDWQVDNLDAATANLLQRKTIDGERLQKAWDERADIRAQYKDMPRG